MRRGEPGLLVFVVVIAPVFFGVPDSATAGQTVSAPLPLSSALEVRVNLGRALTGPAAQWQMAQAAPGGAEGAAVGSSSDGSAKPIDQATRGGMPIQGMTLNPEPTASRMVIVPTPPERRMVVIKPALGTEMVITPSQPG